MQIINRCHLIFGFNIVMGLLVIIKYLIEASAKAGPLKFSKLCSDKVFGVLEA